MSIILGVAEGEVFVNDAEIQKSALQVRRRFKYLNETSLITSRKGFAQKCAESVGF